MDFDFTEEEQLFEKAIDEAAAELIGPGYLQRASKDGYNRECLNIVKEMGLLGFGIPEELGGQGIEITPVMAGLINEILGRYDVSAAMCWNAIHPMVELLNKFGSEEQKKEWFPRLAKGEAIIGGCFTEPHTGTDLANITTTAVQDGDYVIVNGAKASVTHAEAEAHLVLCKVDPSIDPTGMAMVLIPSHLEGIQRSVYNDFGMKQIGRGDILYKNVRVPVSNLVGAGKGGFKGVMSIFDMGRPTIALFCIGSAMNVLHKSMAYTKQREVFGKPLAKYEAISFGFAEHFANLEAARLMAYKALDLRGKGKNNAKEAAMSKYLACPAAFDAIWFGIRVLGHLGYTSEHEACMKLADVMGFAWGDGSWEACKIVAIREIGGREMLPYDKPKK